MSDRDEDNGRRYSTSPSPDRHRSRSRSYSRSRSRSYSPRKRSYSPKRRKRSYSRSYSRSRSRSGSYGRRYKSRSRSPYYRRRRSYSPRYRGRYSRSPMSNRRRHTGNRFNPAVNNVIGVFGLSLYTTEKDLKEVFERYGTIREVKVVYDHQTGKSRGFAFLYFDDIDDAVEAKEHCNGIELDGRKIRVDYSITKRPHTPTPGIYMGKPTRPARSDRDRDRYYDDDDDRYGGRHGSSRY